MGPSIIICYATQKCKPINRYKKHIWCIKFGGQKKNIFNAGGYCKQHNTWIKIHSLQRLNIILIFFRYYFQPESKCSNIKTLTFNIIEKSLHTICAILWQCGSFAYFRQEPNWKLSKMDSARIFVLLHCWIP